MENLNISFLSLISLFVPLLMMGISIFYAYKRMSTEAILLVIGSVIVFLTSVFFMFMPYLVYSRNMDTTLTSLYYSVAGTIAFIGSLLFAIGFFMLVLTVIRQSGGADTKKL
ncbi:hypothetical protein MKJ01_02865 [Chryseobacterium sp. SSA4.19]|uniref:hypothetical protein n=1 Tax=Chryseobacterium sp. SSA4.19 TaxID=2919915 RepID=UPI001F4D50FA|nr:hypothetical protein [Chryseobacterium sp. SSA4.19]MCJ8152704.1 hypothetical protein [Chryseobacterium sp. SSA4.19]